LVTVCRLAAFLPARGAHRDLHSVPTRRSSDLARSRWRSGSHPPPRAIRPPSSPACRSSSSAAATARRAADRSPPSTPCSPKARRSEEHTSELQSRENLVCRLLLEKKKKHRPTQ